MDREEIFHIMRLKRVEMLGGWSMAVNIAYIPGMARVADKLVKMSHPK